ncbi:hypothetical protein [Nocardia sp. BMG111209]|uniref:hypothetical protein n=1 Tax=Nocardia sp. BMG111209 TaxID=1160137 RepID=UPI0003706CEA|nr:hypothetical protein [Nocardia sp. BMG111209]
MSDREFRGGPAQYVTGQLERALETALRTGDSATRARAQRKAQRWREVLGGMAIGHITVGSRTPVADLPAWVTLEVVHGGFATGRAQSEIPSSATEAELIARLPEEVPGDTDRERLNLWYLGDVGRADLLASIANGRYRIEVPEDAALAVVALLVQRGFPEQALDLIADLRPFLARLRFTPAAFAAPRPAGTAVRVTSVGAATAALRAVSTPEQLTRMRATVDVWTPLYDRLVELWCATVDGDLPRPDDAGALRGGWPGRIRPPGWADERARWLGDFAAARDAHEFRGRHAHRKSNFARLHDALLGCDPADPGPSARQIGWVRRALADTIARHGEPGGAARESARLAQTRSLSAPLFADLAAVLATRLDLFPADGGLPSPDPVTAPVTTAEAATIGPAVPPGTVIPNHLQHKALRALEAPVGELVRRGVVGSDELLADVLPQLTSRVLFADITDPEVAELTAQLYTAFRNRRSLLLTELQGQVRFEELPWVAALNPLRPHRDDTSAPAAAARELLRQSTLLTIEHFPHTVLPNPLVSEFHALAQQAGLDPPLVEELAADIFTGAFTEKWRAAADIASRTLEGTLYQAYYDLPAAPIRNAPGTAVIRWNRAIASEFTALCEQRATEAGTEGNYVAHNGAVLEQSQILTTHNLAALVDALDLGDRLRDIAPDAARRAFDRILRRLRQPAHGHAARIQVKNAAYAWRQAIFLLSYCDPATQRAELRRISERAGASRLEPAVAGLAHILGGGRFTPDGRVPGGDGRRLLGWSDGPHWYLVRSAATGSGRSPHRMS